MMFLRYLPLALIWIVLVAFQFLLGWLFLSPWLVILRRDTYPTTLGWFQPDDTPAVGDAMYGAKEAAFTASYPVWLARYVRSVMWGCRNPAYGWLAARGIAIQPQPTTSSVSGDSAIDIGDFGATFGKCYRLATINGVNYFDWKLVGTWGNKYGYMVRFGWNLSAPFKPGEVRNLYVDVRPRIKLP
jgi:hypothetical protein